MKRARDIRDQLEGLLERVEIEAASNPDDHEAIKKAITSGTVHFFLCNILNQIPLGLSSSELVPSFRSGERKSIGAATSTEHPCFVQGFSTTQPNFRRTVLIGP